MKISLFTKPVEELQTEALVICVYEKLDNLDFDKYNAISDGLLDELIKNKEFQGKFGKFSMLRLKGNIKRLVLVGLGKRDEFNLAKAREISGKTAVYVRDNNIKEFSFVLFDDLNPFDSAFSAVEGVRLALYYCKSLLRLFDLMSLNLQNPKNWMCSLKRKNPLQQLS